MVCWLVVVLAVEKALNLIIQENEYLQRKLYVAVVIVCIIVGVSIINLSFFFFHTVQQRLQNKLPYRTIA